MNAHWKKIGLAALLSGAALGSASVASAQSVDFSPCSTLAAAACVQQIDARTPSAPSVSASGSIIRGDSNTVTMVQSGGTRNLAAVGLAGDENSVSATQTGARNRVIVGIAGSQNGTVVTQNGNDNRAAVVITGDRNGTGTIAGGRSVALNVLYRSNPLDLDLDRDGTRLHEDKNDVPVLGRNVGATSTGRTLTMPSNLESGLISQGGSNNAAKVAIVGSDNDFHITQQSGNNSAEQSILGNANTIVAIQGGGDTATQSQIGSNNLSYVSQSGGNNWAKTFQTSSNSEILLSQTNGNNSADLNQFGANNSIALSQTGNVSAVISQFGNRSIAVEQQAGITGSSPLVINQF